jgi:hypothetical protein
MDRNARIVKKIEDLEEQLRDLKLELQRESEPPKSTKERTIEIGDEVRILNPRAGQDKKGVVIKINSLTKYVSIRTTKGTVVRTKKNVAHKDE